jgi:hypothetical protein
MSTQARHWPQLAALVLAIAAGAAAAACSDGEARAGAATPASAAGSPEHSGSKPASAGATQSIAAEPKHGPARTAKEPEVASAPKPAASAAEAPAPLPQASASEAAAPEVEAPAAAPAKQPSLAAVNAMSDAELVQRKDLWPRKVAFREIVRLDATTWWKAGEELPLKQWDGVNVILDEGTFLFDCPAEKTDVVERTRAQAAALSPEAFDLTLAKLRARPDLWPTRLAIASTLQFGDNTVVPAGREVTLRFFEGEQLAVWDREVANYYTVDPQETDLLERSRAVLELPAEKRSPFFLRSLGATLEAPEGESAQRLAAAEYVVVYSARLGCGRCAQFLPQLKEFYGKNAGAGFEVVFLSNDPDAQSAQRYLAESQPPGAAIRFDRRYEAANLLALPLQTLPGLFVFDRNGNLLERNHPDAGQPSASDVLAKFQAQLAQAAK